MGASAINSFFVSLEEKKEIKRPTQEWETINIFLLEFLYSDFNSNKKGLILK